MPNPQSSHPQIGIWGMWEFGDVGISDCEHCEQFARVAPREHGETLGKAAPREHCEQFYVPTKFILMAQSIKLNLTNVIFSI